MLSGVSMVDLVVVVTMVVISERVGEFGTHPNGTMGNSNECAALLACFSHLPVILLGSQKQTAVRGGGGT